MPVKKGSRGKDILQALALMLEVSRGTRITTAALAAKLGVSEAALYRHFPSKTGMFEELIDFIEQTIFTRVSNIINDGEDAVSQCHKIIHLILTFAEKNPGITRLLNGDALMGEAGHLQDRVAQLYNRLESQLKQILREAEVRDGLTLKVPVTVAANTMLLFTDGKISQFVRTGFERTPTQHWVLQWPMIAAQIFAL